MKKVLALIIAVLALGNITAFAFNDVTEDLWYYNAVSKLEELDYISGDNVGNFNPNSEITRQEFSTILLRQQANEEDKAGIYENSLLLSEANNLVDSLRYTVESWNEPMTRYETADILARYVQSFKIEIPEVNDITAVASNIADYTDIPENIKDSVDFCFMTGLMVGSSNGKFNGDNTLTRAEAAVVIYRIIDNETVVKTDFKNFTQLLSEYTTYTTKDANRNFNVNKAAESINGTIVNPGEQFSYYKTIGNPGKEAGYKQSTVISGGKYVKGYGGGVCQDATTLFNAVLKANLQIDERKAHGLKATYVDPGYDATFASGSIDFKFTNNYNTPIMIEAKYDSDTRALTMKIYGGEVVEIPEVKLYTKGKGNTWTLYREVNGEVNYTTNSYYRN